MDIFKNLRGTMSSLFRIGKGGPQIKDNSGVLEFKDATDAAFVKIRALAPAGDDDLVTKKHFDSTVRGSLAISRQADCTSALPTNTGAAGYILVTTAGTGAVVGDLLYDDGSGSGSTTIIGKVEGRPIIVTDALIGGTVEVDADSVYVWDEDGSAWVKIGDLSGTTGGLRSIRFVTALAATADSTALIPANSRVYMTAFEVTTPYSGGTTVTIGQAGALTLLQGTTDNNAQVVGRYEKDQDEDWGGAALVVRVSIAGSPVAGAGVCTVLYGSPDA